MTLRLWLIRHPFLVEGALVRAVDPPAAVDLLREHNERYRHLKREVLITKCTTPFGESGENPGVVGIIGYEDLKG